MLRVKKSRRLVQGALLVGLVGASVGVVAGPAMAASFGPSTNNCYGIYFTTDWNQDCGSGGASRAGYYQSIADCTAPQIPDKSLEKYRVLRSTVSYDGPDCAYGINNILTRYRTA